MLHKAMLTDATTHETDTVRCTSVDLFSVSRVMNIHKRSRNIHLNIHNMVTQTYTLLVNIFKLVMNIHLRPQWIVQ